MIYRLNGKLNEAIKLLEEIRLEVALLEMQPSPIGVTLGDELGRMTGRAYNSLVALIGPEADVAEILKVDPADLGNAGIGTYANICLRLRQLGIEYIGSIWWVRAPINWRRAAEKLIASEAASGDSDTSPA